MYNYDRELKKWIKLIEDQKNSKVSGMTLLAWCKKKHTSTSTYYKWKDIVDEYHAAHNPTNEIFIQPPVDMCEQTVSIICEQPPTPINENKNKEKIIYNSDIVINNNTEVSNDSDIIIRIGNASLYITNNASLDLIKNALSALSLTV